MGHADHLSGPKGDELVTNGTKVRGYDPATGALLWTLAPNSEIAIGTPVVHRNLAIVTAGYPPVRPVYAVRAGARGDISLPAGKSASDAIAWSHDRDGTYISSPIVYRDQLYTLNNNGILTAYDANTGARCIARAWAAAARSPHRRSPATASCYIASEDGDVFVVQAGREYAELAISDERSDDGVAGDLERPADHSHARPRLGNRSVNSCRDRTS